MKKYKKKQVVIQAIQWDEKNIGIINDFCNGSQIWDYDYENTKSALYIKTLEGVVKAYKGDYIVRGVAGEYYPVSEENFNKIYNHLEGNKYIKNPIMVEAVQYNGSLSDITDFCHIYKYNSNKKLMVRTASKEWLEASDGDYIVKEGKGFHPVKPDIFAETYEEAD